MFLKERSFGSLATTLLLVGLNLVFLNVLLDGCSSQRLDLTADKAYSLSDATVRMLRSLDDQVILHGYFSDKTHPLLAPRSRELQDKLREFAAESDGMVRVEISDPNEEEAARDEASSRFGVESTAFRVASKYESGVVNAYFAVVVEFGDRYERYGVDDLVHVDVRPDGEPEVSLRGLEYSLVRGIKKTVFGVRGATDVLAALEQPVALTLIVTPDALPAAFAEIPDKVRTAARELEEKAAGQFTFREIVPDLEDQEALQRLQSEYGARPMSSLLSEDYFYLYGILDTGGQLERIPLTDPDITVAEIRESVVESLQRSTPGFLKTVGIVVPEGEVTQQEMMMAQMERRQPRARRDFRAVEQVLGLEYQVQQVDLAAAGGVPSNVDVLVVLKPRDLGERAVYHLDQYLMRGGRVIVCAGNYSIELDQMGIRAIPRDSGLEDWLAHFGVSVPMKLVLDERNQPLPQIEIVPTQLGNLRRVHYEPYPYLVEVSGAGLREPTVTSGLEAVGIYWGSPVEVSVEETGALETVEILASSKESWTVDDAAQVNEVGYEVPGDTAPRTLAVALSGRFQSFFAGKEPPPAPEDSPPAPGGEEEGSEAPPPDVVLEESPETRLVVIGDAEFLSDFVAEALRTMESGFFQQNILFVQNLIDWVSLDSEMLEIRARGASVRRIDRLEKGEKVTLSWLNVLLPALAVLAFGGYRFMRRRHAAPIVPVATGAGRKEG